MELVLSIGVPTKQVFNSISIRQEFITSISRRKTCALLFPLVLKSKHSKQGHLGDMLKFLCQNQNQWQRGQLICESKSEHVILNNIRGSNYPKSK